MIKMGNSVRRAGIEPTPIALWASVLPLSPNNTYLQKIWLNFKTNRLCTFKCCLSGEKGKKREKKEKIKTLNQLLPTLSYKL